MTTNTTPPSYNSPTLNALAIAINRLTPDDLEVIYNATCERLLFTEYDNEDTRSNRVGCEMIVSNALFDIRDACRAGCVQTTP